VKVELPLGDVVDKVSILLLKQEALKDATARHNVSTELTTLTEAWTQTGHPAMHSIAEWKPLCEVNRALWKVEDELRALEHAKAFDDHFIALARSVYQLNDRRAALKRSINLSLGSTLIEEKSYGP